MAQATGSLTAIAIADETVYGVPAVAAQMEHIYVRSYAVQPRRALLNDDTLRPGVRTTARPDLGKIDLRGQMGTHVAAEDSARLFRHLMGGVSSTGSGPYTHVFSTGALPPSLTIEKDHGPALVGSGRYARHLGCRIASARFGFPSDGYITADYEIIGAEEALSATPLDASIEDNGHRSFTVWNGAYLEGGTQSASLLSMELNYSNDLDADIYPLNNGARRTQPGEGNALITGQATFLFDSMSVLDKAISGTESSLTVTAQRGSGDGSAGNEYVQWQLQQLMYEQTGAPIQGPRGLQVQLSFVGYESGLQITLKNEVAL